MSIVKHNTKLAQNTAKSTCGTDEIAINYLRKLPNADNEQAVIVIRYSRSIQKLIHFIQAACGVALRIEGLYGQEHKALFCKDRCPLPYTGIIQNSTAVV